MTYRPLRTAPPKYCTVLALLFFLAFFYREQGSALSPLVDSRLIVCTHALVTGALRSWCLHEKYKLHAERIEPWTSLLVVFEVAHYRYYHRAERLIRLCPYSTPVHRNVKTKGVRTGTRVVVIGKQVASDLSPAPGHTAHSASLSRSSSGIYYHRERAIPFSLLFSMYCISRPAGKKSAQLRIVRPYIKYHVPDTAMQSHLGCLRRILVAPGFL